MVHGIFYLNAEKVGVEYIWGNGSEGYKDVIVGSVVACKFKHNYQQLNCSKAGSIESYTISYK